MVMCRECKRDQCTLADEVSRIVGAGEWLEWKSVQEGKVALLGKSVEGISDTDGGGGWMYYVLDKKWWHRMKDLW